MWMLSEEEVVYVHEMIICSVRVRVAETCSV